MRLLLMVLMLLLLVGCASKAQLDSFSDPDVTPEPLQQLTLLAAHDFDAVRRPGVEQTLCKQLQPYLQTCISYASEHLKPNRMVDMTPEALLASVPPELYPVLVIRLERERTELAETISRSGLIIGGSVGTGGLGIGTQLSQSGPPDLYYTYQLRLLEQPEGGVPSWLATARSRSSQQPDQAGAAPLKQLARSVEEALLKQGWLQHQ